MLTMKLLILAVLALTASAASWSNYGSYPSSYSSYSSSYPSSYYGSGYGSSIYGTGYGSYGTGYGSYGTGYGSLGSGYGSLGSGYGSLGSGYGSLGSSYSSIGSGYGSYGKGYGSSLYGTGLGSYGKSYSSSLSGTGYGSYGKGYGSTLYGAGYGSYGSGYGSSYGLGGLGRSYYGGSYGSGYSTGYKPSVYGTSSKYPYGAEAASGSDVRGFTSTAGPGKISFTKDFSGAAGKSSVYQTRTPAVSGFGEVKAPITKSTGAWTHGSAHQDSGHGGDVGAPGRVSFTRDVSQISGQSDHHGNRGAVGISGVKTQHIFSKKVTDVFSSGFGSDSKIGAHGPKTTGGHGGQTQSSISEDFSKIIGQSVTTQPETHPYVKTTAPETVSVAHGPSSGSLHDFGTGTHSLKTTGGQTHISFTQDLSTVKDISTITAVDPEVDTFDKVVALAPKPSYGSPHGYGSAYKGGAHILGTVGGQKQVGVARDFSRITGTGQTRGFGQVKPTIHRQSTRYTQRVGTAHRGGSHGISTLGGPRITFILGQAAHRQGDNRLTTFDRPPVPSVAPRKPYGQSHTTGYLSKRTHGFSTPAKPSRIQFTQDISRISGQHISGIKPVVPAFDKLSVSSFPRLHEKHDQRNKAFVTSSVVRKPAQVLATVKPDFTVQQQPVSGQVVYTEEKYYSEEHSPVDGTVTSSLGQGVGDVSSLVTELGAGFGRSADYSVSSLDGLKEGGINGGVHHSLAGIGDQSNFGSVVPTYSFSSGGHSGDKSSFVEVPVEGYDNEKSAVIFHSTGYAPAGGFIDNKSSAYQYSSDAADSGIASLGSDGRAQGYGIATEPFKSYYSSSYPGYSHVSGESPRYDFSPDKNLLYSYSSPYLVSPFSYTYTTGSKYYGQKPIA